MRTIGILGGMSWESTVFYYQHINQLVKNARGGLTSAPMMIDSVDFAQMAQWQREGHWGLAAQYLGERARVLQDAGCQAIGIATNTMHKVYDEVAAMIDVPLVHIADAVCNEARAQHITHVLFLGTEFSMSEAFLRERYLTHGVRWTLPEQNERAWIHEVIFQRLCQGIVTQTDQETFAQLIHQYSQQADTPQAVVLGCTELAMLVGDAQMCTLPILDSAYIHARTLADVVLSD